MKKTDLITKLENKDGFKSIVSDKKAPDSPDGALEKRFLEVATINADGTAGIYHVYYLHDTATDDAWFYNVEVEALDNKAVSSEQVKLNTLADYLKTNFDAYFVVRYDLTNLWAEADVFKLTTGKLVKSSVVVYKKGNSPISHLNVV